MSIRVTIAMLERALDVALAEGVRAQSADSYYEPFRDAGCDCCAGKFNPPDDLKHIFEASRARILAQRSQDCER